MTDHVWQMLIMVTAGLAFVLIGRHPARRMFGAGPSFTLWLLPLVLAAAPWLPALHHGTTPAWFVSAFTAPTADYYAITRPGGASGISPAGWLIPALLAIWLTGALVCLARLGAQYARLWRRIRALPVPLRDALRGTCTARELSRLRMHGQGPAVSWAWRTRVLLPPDFLDRFDTSARALVLRHELTHAKRGDAWWTLAAEVARALLWFHPLAWWAVPRFRLDMELACDERALRASPGRHAEYGRTLVASAAARPLPTLIPWLTAPQLKARVAMISRLPPGRWRRSTGLAAVFALAAAGLLASGTVLGRPPVHAATTGVIGTWEMPPRIAPQPGDPAVVIYPPAGNVKLHVFRPPDTRGIHEHGKVTVDVSVDRTGHAADVTIDPRATTAPADLQSVTVASVRKWKFTPGTEHGKPVSGTARVRLYFVLPSDEVPCKQPADNSKLPSHCYSLDHGKASSHARSATPAPAAQPRKMPDPARAQTPPPMIMPLLIPPPKGMAAPNAR